MQWQFGEKFVDPLTDKAGPECGDQEGGAIDNENGVDKERPSSFCLTLKLETTATR